MSRSRPGAFLPPGQDLIKEMKATVIFKDATYESLSDPKFIKVARQALPHLKALHEECLAAEGRIGIGVV